MKVTADNRYTKTDQASYRSSASAKASGKAKNTSQKKDSSDVKESETMALSSVSGKKSEDSGNFKTSSSSSNNSVGQLASELAMAETRMDVLQVYSKAMRALTDLKMAALSTSNSKEAKKAAQKVKRMEKLIKRIQKKLKHLSKEEQLELQRRKALKKLQLQKEKELREELTARRRKRRKDEKNYADKEMAQDGREASNELMASMAGAGAFAPELAAGGSLGDILSGADMSGGFGGAMSVDISV
ncbi:MAG: hypothetical protein HFG70_03280 [Hungatella sp.]|nr:hypothetical protein [Hungatella sp.]